ncbi:metalloregulator ArsR/SmtB family transcription factor [Chloroflexi bacterium TSY]|nr:metalloregulator ArsR/SmtB family transcription factor [Chloroflexi bacterium TSY]
MVHYSSQPLDHTFGALADPTRRAILARLMHSEASVKELAQPFDMTLTAIGKHVRVLERAGLLTHEKRGRTRICRLEPAPLKDAMDWLSTYARFWDDQFSALADYLNETDSEQNPPLSPHIE